MKTLFPFLLLALTGVSLCLSQPAETNYEKLGAELYPQVTACSLAVNQEISANFEKLNKARIQPVTQDPEQLSAPDPLIPAEAVNRLASAVEDEARQRLQAAGLAQPALELMRFAAQLRLFATGNYEAAPLFTCQREPGKIRCTTLPESSVMQEPVPSDTPVAFEGGRTVSSRDALLALQAVLRIYRQNLRADTAAPVAAKFKALAGEWRAFVYESRPQTFWELGANSLWHYRRLRSNDMQPPPSYQIVLLHPGIVMEHAKDEPSGKRLKGGLLMEWAGINWWKGIGGMRVPIGISASTVYSDRINCPELGHGVTLCIDNKYTVGWARHGHADAYFLSVDLLTLIDNKRTKLLSYRDQIQGLVGKP